jgi:hypothetical protein
MKGNRLLTLEPGGKGLSSQKSLFMRLADLFRI